MSIFIKDEKLFIQNDKTEAVEIDEQDIEVLARQGMLDMIETSVSRYISELPKKEQESITQIITREESIYDYTIDCIEGKLNEFINNNLDLIINAGLLTALAKYQTDENGGK